MKEFITIGQIYILFIVLYAILTVWCFLSGNVLLGISTGLLCITNILMYRREKRKNKK